MEHTCLQGTKRKNKPTAAAGAIHFVSVGSRYPLKNSSSLAGASTTDPTASSAALLVASSSDRSCCHSPARLKGAVAKVQKGGQS
jgi:hypothetical protein